MAAGDWLPIRLHLEDDPAVVALAELLHLDRFAVVGRLVATWTWAGDHADAAGRIGCNGDVTQSALQVRALGAHLDRLTGCPGWSEALATVGWLVFEPAALVFPDWQRWNDKSARNRLLTNRRVAEHRAKSGAKNGNAASVTKSLPHQRTAESALSAEIAPAERPLRGSPGNGADAAEAESGGLLDMPATDAERQKALLFLVGGNVRDLQGFQQMPPAYKAITALAKAGCDESFREAIGKRCAQDRVAAAAVLEVFARWHARRTRIATPGAWIRTALAGVGVRV